MLPSATTLSHTLSGIHSYVRSALALSAQQPWCTKTCTHMYGLCIDVPVNKMVVFEGL